jgi:DNA primase large subunit
MTNYENLILPFTEEVKEKVNSKNYSVTKPSTDDLNLVMKTLTEILKNKFVFPEMEDEFLEPYLVFYPYARIVLSFMNSQNYYDGFANFYAKELRKKVNEENIFNYLEMLELDFNLTGKIIQINFEDYIKTLIRKDNEKLINVPMENGKVFLDFENAKSFVIRFIANRVIEGLPLKTTLVSKSFEKVANLLKSKLQVKRKLDSKISKNLQVDSYPPCIVEIIQKLYSHDKPSHMERYHLATFLFNIRVNYEEIYNLFAQAGDFDEKILKYQLQKVKTYKMASCNTLRSLGLCFTDDSCKDAKTPVDYYFKNLKKRGKK